MRILFLDQFSERGGAQIGLREILDEAVRRGWQAMVMIPGSGPLHRDCADRGIPSCDLPLSRYGNGHKTAPDIVHYGRDSLRAATAVRAIVRQFAPHLIYVNGPRPLPAALFGARGTPVIFHAHSYLDRRYTRAIARRCVDRARMRVIAISEFVAQPFPGATIVYNGVRDHGFLIRPLLPRLKTIGIIGRISPEKGHLDFVDAARRLSCHYPGIRFAIFGAALFADAAYERQVRAAAAGLPIDFHGWTNDVEAALHEIDLLAVPSGPAEGATRVIMEAFSAGTPVVAYASGGIPELVRHGETGLLTAARSADALATGIEILLRDAALMERFSTQGRREWEQRFQIERCQRRLCEVIAEVCSTTSECRFRSEAEVSSHGERLDTRGSGSVRNVSSSEE
ncbi:MAG TPA: glycosyltransferase family 4 protein [Bryobacteraceae bacterium]|nr:glycosyltransferase family 4 protein [Bryobacteraceae bacterium]